MGKKYPNVLSPIKVGNNVFRNRLLTSPSAPMRVQGPELYPTENLITHYANKAKSGAAMVTCRGFGSQHNQWVTAEPPDNSSRWSMPVLRMDDDRSCHYFAQLADAVHFYGAKISMQIGAEVPYQYDVSSHYPDKPFVEPFDQTGLDILVKLRPHEPGRKQTTLTRVEMPASVIDELADEFAHQARQLQEQGWDGVFIHGAYRMRTVGRFLSPLTNKRTDQFGGSLENRARFPLMVFDRIKQKCGKDFIIETSISGCEPEGGFTIEDAIKYAKIYAGHIDLLQVRPGEIDPAHPTGYNPERTPWLYLAEAIKKSGADVKVVAIGGFTYPDDFEDAIASGKADFISGARAWISNPDFGRLFYEGRGEDVVPCLRCNGCHLFSFKEPTVSCCSVNPIWGLENKIERMILPPTKKKKIAVVGGGVAGMEAALISTQRGHSVTLYEKGNALGGLLKTCDHPSFKWPQKDFKNYLVRKVGESDNIKVLLNTEATPEMIKKEKYDEVIAAVGSDPIVPNIPGIKGKNVFYAPDVYGNDAVLGKLGKNIVIIGGGEVGVETGMYLAQKGHEVTVLEMLNLLASTAVPLHFYTMFKAAWEKEKNLKPIVNARCTGIRADKVTYVDANGVEHNIKADSVVISAGMKSKNDLALKFYDTSDHLHMIGDCHEVGNVQKAMRSAFSTASTI
jgi:2,4-dienoyl-CoA reductase-like NADH-dependent reductase (Old Yellow Enzyme family)/NADPH-dependent 2,4-dienoyl-CoA reductase/sulfur reductase-like enzyme